MESQVNYGELLLLSILKIILKSVAFEKCGGKSNISTYAAAKTLQNELFMKLFWNSTTVILTTVFFASILCGPCVVVWT